MVDINDKLLLHLPLDELVSRGEKGPGEKGIEDTGITRNSRGIGPKLLGTMAIAEESRGPASPPEPKRPIVVPDDLFGGCMSFSGDCSLAASIPADGVRATDIAASSASRFRSMRAPARAADVTFCVWFNCADVAIPYPQCLLTIPRTNGNSLQCLVEKGKPGIRLNGKTTVANTELKVKTWYHIALCSDSQDGKLTLYINGKSACALEGILSLAEGGADLNLTIGGDDGNFFHGKMANLRVYALRLSAEEIEKVYLEMDQSAQAAFKLTYPVDFKLTDNGEENILHISDDAETKRVRLELQNTSDKNITIRKTDTNESHLEYHFKLLFKPNTFAPNGFLPTCVGADSKVWECKSTLDSSTGIISIALVLVAQTLKFAADSFLNFNLEYISANKIGGARGTTVQLQYQGLYFKDDNVPLNGARILPLDIVNRRGKKNIPLHAGFIGSDSVLNDGKTINNLILGITNYAQGSDLKLNPRTDRDSTKFYISFQSGDRSFDLVSNDKLQSIGVQPVRLDGSDGKEDTQWTVTAPDTQDLPPFEWEITSTADKPTLEPGEALYLELSNIVTDKPAGSSVVHIRYENVPGYWDGTLIAVVRTSPFSYSGNCVGIGKNDPKEALEVQGRIKDETGYVMPKGGIIMWSGEAKDIPDGWLLCDGTEGTPDLRGRFVVGAYSDAEPKVNDKGEPDQHNHVISETKINVSTSEAGAHDHQTATKFWYMNYASSANKKGRTVVDAKHQDVHEERTSKDRDHQHGVTVDMTGMRTGNRDGDNRPRWYALCYLMKR